LVLTVRFIEYNGSQKICQFFCSCTDSITLKKMTTEISKEAMNTDSYTGKKLLGLSYEEHI